MKQFKIIQGNALELFRQIEDNTVDLLIADPPYNLGKDYGNSSDCQSFESYIEFSQAWLTEAKRVLSPQGTIYVLMGVRFISYIFQIMEQDLGLHFNSWISWHYTQGLGRTKGFSSRHDDILMFTKTKKDYLFNLDAIRIPQKHYRSINNMRGSNPGDVWEFSHIHYCNKNRQKHPTQKPEGLIERLVLASSNEGSLVLDPFAGSGTTLRVCQQLQRSCIGFELNQEYVELIKERLEQPFDSFDSIDKRMERIPLDLNDPKIREDYLRNHPQWFLQNHQGSLLQFYEQIELLYPQDSSIQQKLFKHC
jgi:site-specific DNA-methyltransferase (adenine-specific)